MTSNQSRIDYFLIYEEMLNKSSEMKLEIGQNIEINSDHDYLKLELFFGKNRKSRDERRKHFRFSDNLLLNEDFKDLLDSKIRKVLEVRIAEFKLLKQHYKNKNAFRGLNQILKKG